MRHTDVATGHEQIFNVARIEAAVGHRITIGTIDSSVMNSKGNEWIFRKLFRVLLFGIMEINGPSARDAAVRVVSFGHDIVLGEDDVAHKAA